MAKSTNNYIFFRHLKRPLKFHELLEEIANIDAEIPNDIYILPPENANEEITDEDSGDEETVNMNNLPGSQLRAEVQVSFEDCTQTPELETDSWDSEDDLPLSVIRTKEISAKKKEAHLQMVAKRHKFGFFFVE